MRDKGYRIRQRENHINKRKKIAKSYNVVYYNHDGKYNKSKVHCGCKLCKPTKGYKKSDKQLREEAKHPFS